MLNKRDSSPLSARALQGRVQMVKVRALCCQGPPAHCGVLGCIPGLSPLDSSSTQTPPQPKAMTTKTVATLGHVHPGGTPAPEEATDGESRLSMQALDQADQCQVLAQAIPALLWQT